jgi:oligopeptide transport system permease protein
MILTADLSVNGLISDALPYSAAFGIIAIIFSYSIGIPLGMLAAKNSSKKSGKVLNNVTILIYSLPAVVVVLLLYIVPVSQF